MLHAPLRLATVTEDLIQMDYKVYMCVVCGFLYEEEFGLPEEDIPPGTRWEDIPDNWQCPDCSAMKEDFDMIEV